MTVLCYLQKTNICAVLFSLHVGIPAIPGGTEKWLYRLPTQGSCSQVQCYSSNSTAAPKSYNSRRNCLYIKFFQVMWGIGLQREHPDERPRAETRGKTKGFSKMHLNGKES